MVSIETEYRCPDTTVSGYEEYNLCNGLIELCNEYITKDMVMVETGTAYGVSASVFARFAKTVYTFDNEVRNGQERLKELPNVHFFLKDSREAASLFFDESIDFIYFDACHTYDFLKSEYLAWLPRMKTNGIIAGHDYQWECPGVKKFVEEYGGYKKLYKDSSWILNR